MLKGRLGLEKARIPHSNRTGLLFLSCGALTTRDGTLSFSRSQEAIDNTLESGDYSIPFQNVSSILLGPGTTVSHDALRILARHGTALVAIGEDGVRMYTAPPLISGRSILARRQAMAWSRKKERIDIARRMYAWRLGEIVPHRDIEVLRGIEGARMRETYKLIANRIGIAWKGRNYDRNQPEAADIPNQAINHASSATEAAASIAVNATATIPQLGFIHEDPGQSFVLDISDLFRDEITLPAAF
nr:type I-E CRISPR-associated endonuclease Cas1e [Pseudomonadota bacterium]